MWLATPENFLFPAAAAGTVYRQKFREAMRAAGFEKNIDPSVWRKDWIVDVEPVQDGRAVLKYLAPYAFRIAISDNRIVECTESTVTYRWTPSGTKQQILRRVEGWKFVRGFLQHVLPKGFRKVRNYGWMASNCRTRIELVRWLVWQYRDWVYWLASGIAPQPERHQSQIRCRKCGGTLNVRAIIGPDGTFIRYRSDRTRRENESPFAETRTTIWHDTG